MSSKRSRHAFEEGSSREPAFVKYGTPVPAGNSKDDGSFVPLWKQEVTDERGRKRLHGAFTGGFSAGYFNTVGSKEGWTPSTFTSSRKSRAKAVESKPEDFMDEEDLREAEEARLLEMNRNFAVMGAANGGSADTLQELLVPSTGETMGSKLLRKMGWKDGQGIGPRTLRKAVTSDNDGKTEDDPNANTFSFAPTNTCMVTFSQKNDSFGLGYVREQSLGMSKEQEDRPSLKPTPKKKLGGAAFGVGVLNEDGEDEEDPYEIRPKTLYNRTIGGSKLKGAARAAGRLRSAGGKHVFVPKKLSGEKAALRTRKCSDGRLPLPGFILSTVESFTSAETYSFPDVPQDWKPKSAIIGAAGETGTVDALDSRARGSLLGEKPLPGKSVFDFLSPAARDRIAAVTGKSNLPPGRGEAPAPSNPSSYSDVIPHLDADAARSALSGGFMPYSDDPEKRARYVAFLEIKSGQRGGLPERKYGMNTQDWVKEMNEFVGAARIFKPLAGSMANRFTSSKSAPAVPGNTGRNIDDRDMLIIRPSEKPVDTAEEAAKMAMYGPLTRKLLDFVPNRLLCKRFGVRPPVVQENPEQPKTAAPADIPQNFGEQARRPEYEEAAPVSSTQTVNAERNEALEEEKAADEVFAAVFGDDSD